MNKIQEVMQKFRSGSESEKGSTVPPSAGDAGTEHKEQVTLATDSTTATTTSTTTPGAESPAVVGVEAFSALNFPPTPSVTTFMDGSRMGGQDDSDDTSKASGEKKPARQKPKGTFEYIVEDRDTLVKIGAHFDVTPSELMKVNKMMSRTIFPGQTLFIPDPEYVPSPPSSPPVSPTVGSPVDARPRVDVPYVEMADRPMAAVPGHAVQVTHGGMRGEPPSGRPVGVVRQPSQDDLDEADQECLKRFLKMPVRRFVEQAPPQDVIPVKGTLLLTPNALMFDPDLGDPLVMSGDNQSKYQLVVYMEDLKSVAIFNDYLRKPKEPRATTKAETYRGSSPQAGATGSKVEGSDGVKADSPQGDREEGHAGDSPQEGHVTGRTSEELEKMGEMGGRAPDLIIQPGRASEEIEHTMSSSGVRSPSGLQHQMSRSSEAASTEISQLHASGDVCGETRDFGPHLGRSSSEVHRQQASTGRVSASSPSATCGQGETITTQAGGGGGGGRSESVSEATSVHTPTQGFAPVHFTDRSPPNANVIAHPTPVSGQRASSGENATSSSQQQLILSPSSLSDLGVESDRLPLSSSPRPSPSKPSQDGSDSVAQRLSVHSAEDSSSSSTASNRTQQQQQTAPAELRGDKPAMEQQTGETSASGLMSSFSPSQQISNLFQFTSNFIRGATSGPDRKSPTASPTATLTPPGHALRLKSGCTKEEVVSALGPSPEAYRNQGAAPCFTEEPYYLQLRPGIPYDRPQDAAPRAFDHRNQGGYLDEYWFAVPRNMTDRLYNFLMTWQPEAYGDREETATREKFFYDTREVRHLLDARRADSRQGEGTGRKRTGTAGADSVTSAESYLHIAEDHFSNQEKAWVIIHRSEVALPPEEEEEDSLDETNMPELVGGTSVILTEQRLKDLYKAVPRQVSVGYNYELVYATHRDGFSLLNLYSKMAECPESPVWLLIRDNHRAVFGAYLSESIKESKNFYGSGYTFLFSWHPHFRHFHWQGDNDFYMNGQKDYFSVGSGDGQFGLWLDNDLYRGRSQECKTFRNPVLTKEEDFCIVDLEVWRFTDLM